MTLIKSPSPKLTVLGKGKILFARHTDGVRGPILHLGNCPKFSLGTEVETIEMKSSMDAAAATYVEDVKQKKAVGSIETFEFSVQNLSLLTMGVAAKTDQAGGAIVDEVLAAAADVTLGAFYYTANRGISAVSVEQGAVTLVEGTDYVVVDAMAGLIWIKETGAAVEGGADDLTISYTAAALTGATAHDVIRGAASAKIEGSLYYVSDNIRGPQHDFRAWRVSMKPEGELDLISDEYLKGGFKFTTLDDSAGDFGGSADEPFYRLISYLPA